MTSNDSIPWRHYQESFRIFGPLMTIAEITAASEEAGFSVYDQIQRDALRQLAAHARGFLAQPNERLGRDGHVCPFVALSIKKNLFRATATKACDPSDVQDAMDTMRHVFAHMPPASPELGAADGDPMYKAIIVAFPLVSTAAAPVVIDALQKRLKLAYLRDGLMIGQFHPACPEPGLHNRDFRPLQAPVPSLAIRHITKFDTPFMLDEPEYQDAYLARFGDEGRRRIDILLQKNAEKLCPFQAQNTSLLPGSSHPYRISPD
jgi:hypothetical protein